MTLEINMILIFNKLHFNMCPSKVSDLFQCNVCCVLVTHFKVVDKRMYVFLPYYARTYDIAVDHILYLYADF